MITSTARASSVFLSSYRNTVLNQSACVFALGYFLNKYNVINCQIILPHVYIKKGLLLLVPKFELQSKPKGQELYYRDRSYI